MKTLKLIVIGMMLFLANILQAQISVRVGIGSPPPWGPAGYAEARYYYLPDVQAYYDVQSSLFIYFDGRAWVRRAYLPDRYRNYDLYGGYKVVMTDYHGNSPYIHFSEHRTRYARGYRGEAQRTIGERPGREHSVVRNSHEEKHENREAVHGNDKRTEHDNGKNAERGNDKGNSHNNGKNMKEEHGHEGGNDKRK